jgi:rRNA maturation endonuclease Nob1
LLGAVIIGFLLFIRSQDLPAPEPVSPFKHLDERKAAIYESLRDLQFEYRVNKLSDEDYQTTKVELQKELARVLAEVDRIKSELGVGGASVAAPAVSAPAVRNVCPSCGAKFEKALKFCGECGKPMGVSA